MSLIVLSYTIVHGTYNLVILYLIKPHYRQRYYRFFMTVNNTRRNNYKLRHFRFIIATKSVVASCFMKYESRTLVNKFYIVV